MEAVAAVGLSSSIIAFIDFSGKAIATYRELLQSTDTAENKDFLTTTDELGSQCAEITRLANELANSGATLSQEDAVRLAAAPLGSKIY